MLHFIQAGDIFESPAKYIVNPVNTQGVMGKGMALEYKKRYPKSAKQYVDYCKAKVLKEGEIAFSLFPDEKYTIHFATKGHWKNNSNLDRIEFGLSKLYDIIKIQIGLRWKDQYTIDSIAIPALGCGLGGLKWEDVKALIIKYFGDIEGVDFYIYEPL